MREVAVCVMCDVRTRRKGRPVGWELQRTANPGQRHRERRIAPGRFTAQGSISCFAAAPNFLQKKTSAVVAKLNHFPHTPLQPAVDGFLWCVRVRAQVQHSRASFSPTTAKIAPGIGPIFPRS